VTEKMLALKTAVALILTAVLAALCYFVVDQPVAWFVYRHRCIPYESLLFLAAASEWMKHFAIVAILLVVAWRAWKRGGRVQTVLLAISANLIVTTALKQFLKWGFGRYWPETWTEDMPSLIGSGDYGFHPFHYGAAYESFPSGHAAVVFSVIAILWLSYPRWRWLYATICGSLAAALVGLNFHFVGDVIAGATLGSITGIYIARRFGLDRPRHCVWPQSCENAEADVSQCGNN
jgi:membrane-associated phospholipid phosphatase